MKWAAVLAFAAGLVLLAFVFARVGMAPVAHALAALGIAGLIVICLAHIPVMCLLALAWWRIGNGRPAWHRYIWARAIRDAAAEALPFSQIGGYAAGVRALTLYGSAGASAGISGLMDLMIEFAAKLPYTLLGLALLEMFRGSEIIAAILAVLCVVAVFALSRPRALASPKALLARVLHRTKRFSAWRERLTEALSGIARQPAALRASLLLHILCWLLGAGETWLIFHLMHARISVGAALAIDSLVGAIRMAVFFVPASVGVQEFGYVLLCGLFGLAPGTALAFSFARRARDLAIAAPVLLSWQWREFRSALLPGAGSGGSNPPSNLKT